MTLPKSKLRPRTAQRSRSRHERAHYEKDGRNDKGKNEQVSHCRKKVPYLESICNLSPQRPDDHERS
jgi:hypothetical protein